MVIRHVKHDTGYTEDILEMEIKQRFYIAGYLPAYGMLSKAAALQHMTLALGLVRSRPDDPAHSKFAGIVRRETLVLCEKFLTTRAVKFSTEDEHVFDEGFLNPHSYIPTPYAQGY